MPATSPVPAPADALVVGVHDGDFHADDAFAVAALRLAHAPRPVQVVRTRDPQRLATCDLRVDVGRRHDPDTGDFDHHQPGGAGERANGVPYASFGLIWAHYGQLVCRNDQVRDAIDESLVQGVDANDCGFALTEPLVGRIAPMTVSDMIYALNNTWTEGDGHVDVLFEHAAWLAEQIIAREVAVATAKDTAGDLVRAAISAAVDPRVIVLEQGMPWRSVVTAEAPDALYVVYPKTDGWGVQAVPQRPDEFVNRKDLPEEWAGLDGADLAAVTGVPDAVFAHNARFIAGAQSREGALALAALAVAA